MANDICSGFSHRDGHCCTEPSRSACDQCRFAIKSELVEDQELLSARLQPRSRLTQLSQHDHNPEAPTFFHPMRGHRKETAKEMSSRSNGRIITARHQD